MQARDAAAAAARKMWRRGNSWRGLPFFISVSINHSAFQPRVRIFSEIRAFPYVIVNAAVFSFIANDVILK